MLLDDPSSKIKMLFVMATDQEYGPALKMRIRPLITGVGPIESAISTTLRLQELVRDHRKPQIVVSLGSAGSGRYDKGTVWQIASVSWRDMDASRLGFEKGVTPFANHPAAIPLLAPIAEVPRATLSTGSAVLGGEEYRGIVEDLVDMETFAIVRACTRFEVPVIGIRGVSDGPGDSQGVDGWKSQLEQIDNLLAQTIDLLPAALAGTLQEQAHS